MQEKGDAATVTAAAGAVTSIVSQALDWLHILAAVVAIVAGLYAIAVHRKNLKK